MERCVSGYIDSILKVALIVLLFGYSEVALCLNDAKTGERLPFTLELPVTSEQTVSLFTDTSATHYCCPLLGKVISPYGSRGGRTHTGVDIKLKRGDTVKAALKGVVKMAQTYSGYGKLVILKHPEGYETYYAHLSKYLVSKGDTVYAGQTVGLGGRTGRATTDHLHFEVRKNGTAQNPERYFGFANGEFKKHILSGVGELFIASTDKHDSPTEKNLTEKGSFPEKSTPEEKSIFVEDGTTTVGNDYAENESTINAQPTDCYVTIKKGDTLYSLAKRYGITVKQLQDLNNMESNLLKIGIQLRVN